MPTTLEEIQSKISEVREKIPKIKTGIEALSASDLTEGAGQVNVPDIGDQDTYQKEQILLQVLLLGLSMRKNKD